jgi:hypothetical protein
MISINLDLDAGTAKLTAPTTIKAGGGVPVTIALNRHPGGVISFQLALGPQSSTQAVLAYLDEFSTESETLYKGTLNANDVRLIEQLAGKQVLPLDCEVSWTLDGERQIAPNLPITVQPPMITGPQTSEGGPVYALASSVSGFSGDVIIGDKTITFLNGLIKSIA